MTRERTLFIIKPDVASTDEHVGAILLRVIAAGLVPIALQRSTMTAAQAGRLYEAHVGRSYHARNIKFVTSGPSVQVVLEGESACGRLRGLMGATDPMKAYDTESNRNRFFFEKTPSLTLRAQFGTDLPRNAVHGSDNARDAEREIGIFFPVSLRPEYELFWRSQNGE